MAAILIVMVGLVAIETAALLEDHIYVEMSAVATAVALLVPLTGSVALVVSKV